VTASTVVSLIWGLRTQLKKLAQEDQPDTSSKRFANLLLKDFEERWVHNDGTVFCGTVRRGKFNRQVGIHPALVVASFLDPRHKQLGTMDANSKKAVHKHVLELMKKVEQEIRDNAPTMEEVIEQAMNFDSDSDEEEDNPFFAMMVEQEQAASQESAQMNPGEESVHDKCMAELKKFDSTESLTT